MMLFCQLGSQIERLREMNTTSTAVLKHFNAIYSVYVVFMMLLMTILLTLDVLHSTWLSKELYLNIR